ncbi:MAG: hypothetical protein AAF085_02845 [Planctomycetota bacterium]
MQDASDEMTSSDTGKTEVESRSSIFEFAHVIGKTLWELTGKSIGRLVLTFAAVYLASLLPSLLIILGVTVASQTYTRNGLLILVVLCMIPIATIVAFNRVIYLGLRDIVKELGLGQQIGAAFVAYIEPSGRMRLPLADLSDRLKVFSKRAREEAKEEFHGVRGLFLRSANAMVFYTACFVIKRISKGCIVDGEVDLVRLATALGERADDMLITYFKKILWDLTRLVISFALLVFWILLYLTIKIITLLS